MGRITGTRGDVVVREPSIVSDQSGDSSDVAQALIANELVNLTAKTVDLSRPVDEYRSVTGNVTTLEILPDYEMDELIEAIIIIANPTQPGPAPVQPAVPATTVAQQNVNSYPVQVVISANGATITAVIVNGITVGVLAGTYTVPAYGAISMTYTVATPTWVWTDLGTIPNVVTLQLGDRVWAIPMGFGIWSQEGLKLRLARHDRRIVTQPVAGPLSLNLTGHADMSGYP
jgi:hypothetical protein